MKEVTINIYTFAELSDEAKEKASSNYRNNGYNDQTYFDEITESVKAAIELFNLRTGREWTDIRTSHIDDNILELSGVRLYKYLMNNYYLQLFTPTYIKTVDRELRCKQFICEVHKGHDGKPYTQIYSKLRRDHSCVLTGVCYDDDILQPVYDFLKKPDSSTTFADLISEIETAITKSYRDTEEWINSDEFITGEIEANDYEFTEDGEEA